MKQYNPNDAPVPRLHPNIKKLNGRSTKRLTESIETLSELLDDMDETHDEKRSERPDSDHFNN